MKISNEIKELILNNKQIEHTAKNDRYCDGNTYQYSYIKRPTNIENVYSLYTTSFAIDDMFSQDISFIGIVDMNKEEFIYINNDEYKYCKNDILQDVNSYKKVSLNEEIKLLEEAIKEFILDYANTEDIIDEYEKTHEVVSAEKINKLTAFYLYDKMEYNFLDHFNIHEYINSESLSFVCDILLNPSKLNEEIANEYIEDNSAEYMDFIYINQKIKQKINELDNNQYGSRRKDILKILNDHKKIEIYYKKPNNKESMTILKPETIIIDRANLYLKNFLMLFDKGIPISEITRITADSKEIYNANNYEPLTQTKLERALNWYYLDCLENIDKEMFDDKEFMDCIINKRSVNICYLGDKLKKDYEYIMNKLQENKNIKYINIDYMFKDEKFLTYFLNNINKEKISKENFCTILDNIPDTYFKEYDKLIKLLNISNHDDINYILDKVDDEMINNSSLFTALEDKSIMYMKRRHIERITNSDKIYEICRNKSLTDYILANIEHLDDKIIKNKSCMLYLLDKLSIEDLYSEDTYKDIILHYKDDEQILNLIAKIVPLFQTDHFLKLCEIDEKNKNRIFELSSINNNFFAHLTDEELCTYLTSEASEIYNIQYKNNLMKIDTAYGYFLYHGKYDEIVFYDAMERSFSVSVGMGEAHKKEVQEVLIETIKEYNPDMSKYKTLHDIHMDYANKEEILK